MLANLVDARSKTNGNVSRVVPYDPENSFLMRKLDGCYEGISAGCTALPEILVAIACRRAANR